AGNIDMRRDFTGLDVVVVDPAEAPALRTFGRGSHHAALVVGYHRDLRISLFGLENYRVDVVLKKLDVLPKISISIHLLPLSRTGSYANAQTYTHEKQLVTTYGRSEIHRNTPRWDQAVGKPCGQPSLGIVVLGDVAEVARRIPESLFEDTGKVIRI